MTSRTMTLRWPGAGFGLLLGCLGFIANLRCEAQNLVPNPGFEEADTCSVMDFGMQGPIDWHSANGTPDYLQSCLPSGAFSGLPVNFHTFQMPYEGFSCAGLYTYYQNGPTEYREWIIAPLLEPLMVGETYYCSFRANAGFAGNAEYPQIWLANDKVGMLFTMQNRMWEVGDTYPVPLNEAHILYPQILSDTVGWTLVSGSFVADSAYQYVLIGQFFANALTDTLHFADPNSVFPWYPRGYTLVDAVCVSPNPDGCDLGQGVGEVASQAAVLFPNPVRDKVVVTGRPEAEVQVLDAVGCLIWKERIAGDRMVLEVGAWARGAYVLRMVHQGKVESFKFVLAE